MASLNFHKIKHITNKSLRKKEAAWRKLSQCVSSCESSVGCVSFCERWALLGKPGTRHSTFRSLLTSPRGAGSQMLRAAKVFTKVTCVLASASLRLLSLWPLLLSRALWRCLSSCRFFFSRRCCSLLCLLVTWKRRQVSCPHGDPLPKADTGLTDRERGHTPPLSKNTENPPIRPELMYFPSLLKFPLKFLSPRWAGKWNQFHSPPHPIHSDLRNSNPGPCTSWRSDMPSDTFLCII